MEEWPTRMSLGEKLERRQISESDFESYCAFFIKNWSRYRLKEGESDWYLVKNKKGRPVRLTKDIVAYHLLGKYCVATFGPEIPQYLSLDVDQSPEQLTIYQLIRAWLKDPLVFRSSKRGGLHVYAFFSPDFFIKAPKLLNITRIELKRRGMEATPGLCEVFPQPAKSLRLPLGKGSFLLDPETLQPLCIEVKEAIRCIEKSIRLFTLHDLFPGLQEKLHDRQ